MVNPSPYMIYLQSRGSILVASSPEILCRLGDDGTVTNRSVAVGPPSLCLPPNPTVREPSASTHKQQIRPFLGSRLPSTAFRERQL